MRNLLHFSHRWPADVIGGPPDLQVAACVAGAAHAALQLLQSPQSVRQRAAELLRELLPGIASAPDESVFNAFAKVSACGLPSQPPTQ